MKKLLIPIIIGWVAIPPASASFIKCVYAVPGYSGGTSNYIDWDSQIYTYDKVNGEYQYKYHTVTGVAVVSTIGPNIDTSTDPGNLVLSAESTIDMLDPAVLSDAGDAGHNLYCWCKMLTPAVSKWVSGGYTHSLSEYDVAISECADYCAKKDMVSKYFLYLDQ